MKNNSEQNEGENLYFPRSSFGARRKKVNVEILKMFPLSCNNHILMKFANDKDVWGRG